MVVMNLTPEQMAGVAHAMNRQFRIALGQAPGPHWNEADEAMKASTVHGVLCALEGATPEELHEEWMAFRGSQGWTWGPAKDPAHKRHPCMVPYDKLPPHEKVKDAMFHAVIHLMRGIAE